MANEKRFVGNIRTITKDTLPDLRDAVREKLETISYTYSVLVVSVQVIEQQDGRFSAIIFSKQAA